MPVETPRLPRETHQYLLQAKGNTHLPLIFGEVAVTKGRPMWNLYRGFVGFMLGCVLTLVSVVAFFVWVLK